MGWGGGGGGVSVCNSVILLPRTTPPSPSASSDEMYLDEQSHRALETVGVASSLVDEIKRRLEGSPDNVGLLWRLARALTHLSLHKKKQEETDSEKECLLQGISALCGCGLQRASYLYGS